ncbi:MAG TPA: DUF433 domain-containing protein [Chloroflexota bacterium]|nr:DUF433 domain-containing protein [Chloroflexota bacterium]
MAIAFQHLVKASNGDTEIARTGIRVYTISGLYDMGDSPEHIADEYDLPLAAVLEALAYAADHPDEMETMHQAELAAQQRVIGQMPEQVREDARRTAAADERAYQEAVRKAREARRGTPVP